MDGERADRRPISPDHVIDAPAFGVGRVEKSVVTDDVAVDDAEAFARDLSCEFINLAEGRDCGCVFRSFAGGEIRQRVASAEVGVASTSQDQVTVQCAANELAFGDDTRRETVVGPEHGQRSGGGEELGVGGWLEELAFVEAVDGGAVEGGDLDAPVIAGYLGSGEEGGDLVGEGGGWRLGIAETVCAGARGCSAASVARQSTTRRLLRVMGAV